MKKRGYHKLFAKFVRNTVGATALEFAILAPIFMTSLFSVIEIGYHAMVQSDLDALAYNFTMSIAISEDAGLTKEQVVDALICDQPVLLVKCSRLDVGVDAYNRFTFFDNEITNNFTDTWKTGCGGATLVTELNYPTQNFVLPFVFGDIVFKNGEKYHRARGLIKRELQLIGNGESSLGTGSGGLPC